MKHLPNQQKTLVLASYHARVGIFIELTVNLK